MKIQFYFIVYQGFPAGKVVSVLVMSIFYENLPLKSTKFEFLLHGLYDEKYIRVIMSTWVSTLTFVKEFFYVRKITYLENIFYSKEITLDMKSLIENDQ